MPVSFPSPTRTRSYWEMSCVRNTAASLRRYVLEIWVSEPGNLSLFFTGGTTISRVFLINILTESLGICGQSHIILSPVKVLFYRATATDLSLNAWQVAPPKMTPARFALWSPWVYSIPPLLSSFNPCTREGLRFRYFQSKAAFTSSYSSTWSGNLVL